MPDRRLTELRHDIERSLHDNVAINMSALTIELDLISGQAAADPALSARIDAARGAVCRVIDDLRRVGATIYPRVLNSTECLESVLTGIAGHRGLVVRLDLPRHDLTSQARTRIGLLVADHLATLPPQTEVTIRIRGRRLVRVRFTERRTGRPAESRRWAVVR